MEKGNLKTKEGGYAILFAIVVVGIISLITIGLSNAAYKQLMLSSVAKDSMKAFYQSDIASECALYADNEFNMLNIPAELTCGGHLLSFTPNAEETIYELNLTNPENISSLKCFRINVTKTILDDYITTKITALGYNICNKANLRTVERAVEVNY